MSKLDRLTVFKAVQLANIPLRLYISLVSNPDKSAVSSCSQFRKKSSNVNPAKCNVPFVLTCFIFLNALDVISRIVDGSVSFIVPSLPFNGSKIKVLFNVTVHLIVSIFPVDIFLPI